MRFIYLGLFTGLLLFSGCTNLSDFKDISLAEHDAEYAIPLVNSSISMGDILKNFEESSSLVVEQDGVLHFKYSGDVLTKTSEDVFSAINETLEQSAAVPITADTISFPFSFPDELEVDRMDLKQGNFYYLFESTHDESVYVHVELPNFIKNNTPLTVDLTIPPSSGSPNNYNNILFPISLEGYSIIPSEGGNLHVYSSIRNDANEHIELDNKFVGIEQLAYSYAEGYLGQHIYDESRDTIFIDFFDYWIDGDIYFEEPIITIDFENSFGVPTTSIVEEFNIFTVREDVLPLESSFITEGIEFPYPTLDEVGEVKTKVFEFNKDNSNIATVLGAGPLAIDYDVDAFTNPEGDTGLRGFATDSSYYKVRVNVDLPLYGKAVSFISQDTFDIDLSNFDQAKEVEFKVVCENGLGLNADIQAYFLNDDLVTIDSLFDSATRLVQAAAVDSEGFPNEIGSQITYIPIAGDKLTNIQNASKINLQVTFSTYNDGNTSVKVTNEQKLDVRMGAKIKI